MVDAYSGDLRERAVRLLDEGFNSVEVADMLRVSDSWVRKMRLRRDQLGHLMPGSPPGRERKLTTDDVVALGVLLDDRADATLEELVELLAKARRVRVSVSTISRRLIELGLTRKKRQSTPPKPSGQRSRRSEPASSVGTSSVTRRG